MTLIEAAATIGYSYNRILRLVLVRQLKGERKNGRWFVDATDVERLRGELKDPPSPTPARD
jgi:hypothetical protein